MSVAFPTLHIQACHLFTPILPSPSMTVYMSVYPYLSLSLYPRHDCSLLHKEPGSDTLHTKQLTQSSSCIIKIRETERERGGDRRTHLTNDVLVFEPAPLIVECYVMLKHSSWVNPPDETQEWFVLIFYQMIKARVEILNLSVAFNAIQSFGHLYTGCTDILLLYIF